MAVARILTGSVNGIEGELVWVESDSSLGIPGVNIVGLPDATVNEAKERVKAAIKNAGFDFPQKKVVINLAPADVRKAGAGFDLPMAVAVLHGAEYFPQPKLLEHTCFIGELSLDGTVRPVRGVLAMALMARQNELTCMVVPQENMAEAALVEGLTVYGLSHLSQLPRLLDSPAEFEATANPQAYLDTARSSERLSLVDFADVKGQAHAKRALEIAAAGAHNIAMFGPPGSGKSMLAKAFAGILPPMDFEEMLEVSRIYSVAGLLDPSQVLKSERPFRAPHHSASQAGITGGGSHPKPGEITLAHRGVLFLDEFTEFPRPVLEVLRQPLEDAVVTVSRVQQSLTFPAQFILVAAMNPCPCGYKGDAIKACVCTPIQTQRYLAKISGPIMDRIDLQLEVPRLADSDLLSQVSAPAESSETIRQRILQARDRQLQRFKASGIRTNREMSPSQVKTFCALDTASEALMTQAIQRFNLSGRSFDRLLKLTRTIADLANQEKISSTHLAEALQYRGFDKLLGQQATLSFSR